MGQRLKILIILETSGGGSGRHVIDLVTELIRMDCSVSVVYSGLRASSDFLSEIKAVAGLHLIQIDMRRSPCPGDVIAAIKIRKVISHHGPFNIIHGHSSKGGALARIAALNMPGIRVYTPHAFRTLDPFLGAAPYRFYSFVERLLSKFGSSIILVSEAEKQHALQLGLPAKKLQVIPNGMVSQELGTKAAIRARVGISLDEICVGYVGRLVPQKAPDRVLRSFALIAKQCPQATLVMLGDGSLQSELHQLAKQLDIDTQIKWLAGESGAEFMSALDMFVMPSLYEAFPYVLLEAANAGLPIIATPVGGTDEMLADKVNGYVVAHDPAEDMASAMQQLVASSELRSQMGEKSREIGARYSSLVMAEKTLALYQQLIGS